MPNFISPEQLQVMGGLDFPQYMIARDQQALMNQLNQQELQAKSLQNMFDLANNPLKLEEARLSNAMKSTKNKADLLAYEQDLELDPYSRAAGKSKLLEQLDSDKVKRLNSKLDEDLLSPDPEKRLRATEALLQTREFQKIKANNDARVQAAEARANGAMDIARMRENGLNTRHEQNLQQRQQAAQARLQEAAAKAGGKLNFEQGIVAAMSRLTAARNAGDSQALQDAQDDLEMLQRMQLNKAQAGQAGKVDIGAEAGMKTLPGPQPVAPPQRPMAPVQDPTAGMPPPNSPQAHLARAVGDVQALQRELSARNLDRGQREILDQELKKANARVQQLQQNAAPQAPGQPSQPQAAPQAPAAPANTNAPAAGSVMKGYRFKGGDPSKKENWEKV